MRKSLISVLSTAIGIGIGAASVNHVKSKQVKEKAEKVDKFKTYYNLLNRWLMLNNEGKTLDQYFVTNKYKTIAIYGMGEMGNRLLEVLKDSQIEVKYAIDQNPSNTYSELPVFSMMETLETVDVIVVSAVFAFQEIKEELMKKVNCPVISLEDVVFDM